MFGGVFLESFFRWYLEKCLLNGLLPGGFKEIILSELVPRGLQGALLKDSGTKSLRRSFWRGL